MKKVLGAAIGSCVHVAGVYNFLKLAQQAGYQTCYLGGAVAIDALIGAIIEDQPDIIAVGYRLDSASLQVLLDQLQEVLATKGLVDGREYVFGGTVETVAVAQRYPLFTRVFDGRAEGNHAKDYFGKGLQEAVLNKMPPQNLAQRISANLNRPLMRHHIGLESIYETSKNIEILAKSRQLDIISLAPDQNCQQYFYSQELMNPAQAGAGGVPLRFREDFIKLYSASRYGNYPLMRCYSGTERLLEFSELLKETINSNTLNLVLGIRPPLEP